MNLSVTGSRVLIAPIAQHEHQTAAQIHTIDNFAPDVMGTVVAIGDVRDVQVDDVVIFSPDAGQRLTYDGVPYLILDADELLGVWE